jgi:hypothetical protein
MSRLDLSPQVLADVARALADFVTAYRDASILPTTPTRVRTLVWAELETLARTVKPIMQREFEAEPKIVYALTTLNSIIDRFGHRSDLGLPVLFAPGELEGLDVCLGWLREASDPSEARNRFFYEYRFIGTPDTNIMAAAKRDHPEWGCDFTIQHMRKLASDYQKARDLPLIPSRKKPRPKN